MCVCLCRKTDVGHEAISRVVYPWEDCGENSYFLLLCVYVLFGYPLKINVYYCPYYNLIFIVFKN